MFFRRRGFFEVRGLAQRHVAHDFQLETFKGRDFGGVVRQQLYTTEPQVMKYLGPDSVITIRAITGFQARFALADRFFLHHGVSAQLIDQIEAMLALAQIKHHATAGGGNFFQRRVQLKAGVVDQRAKHVAGDVLRVHAHQHRFLGCAHHP